MWNFLIQRSVKKTAMGSAHDAGLPARRRRPRPFAGAEPLENRALLSATGSESTIDRFAMDAGANNVPPIAADISFASDASSSSAHEKSVVENGTNVDGDRGGTFREPNFAMGMSDLLFAAIAPSSPVQRTSGINFNDQQSSFGDTQSGISGGSVEFRVAETGQVISAVGSSAQVRDSSGLTVNGDGVSMTYIRATDSEGRAFSQLVFVTRAARSAPESQPKSLAEPIGAVVADGGFASDSNTEEQAVRADLHDFATALDAANQELATPSPTSQQNETLLTLAAATRTRWLNSTRVSVSAERSASETNAASTSARSTSIERSGDDSECDSAKLPVVPVFDPTTRNVMLSVCLLGVLARATARRRRRLKAAELSRGFAAL